MSDTPTPETDCFAQAYISGEEGMGPSSFYAMLDKARSLERRLTAMTRERDSAVQSMKDSMRNFRSTDVKRIEAERERDKARACLKVCAGLAEHWRMQASVTSRRSAWSANGALEKCAVELEKALARLDEMEKEGEK